MDYGYQTTSYGAQGGNGGGGFLPGSQSGDSPSAKRTYGKDTLRPVTIKQLVNAHHPHPDAEYFMIDGSEATQVTLVGQIRNISAQTTNVTYKLDDGTGIIEVKVWVDAEAAMEGEDAAAGKKAKLVEQGYARVWGRLKAFNNKRHVGANVIRPVQDFNEVQYHLLEATVVHLHFTRGPLEAVKAGGQQGAGGQANGAGGYGRAQQNGMGMGEGGGDGLPPNASAAARKVLQCIRNTPQTNEGLHMQDIAQRAGMEIGEVMKGGEELGEMGMVYSTVDEHTWALMDVN